MNRCDSTRNRRALRILLMGVFVPLGLSGQLVSQPVSLHAIWAHRLLPGEEVVDVHILPDGRVGYSTTSGPFIYLLAPDGTPEDSLPLQAPPFAVAPAGFDRWEAINVVSGKIESVALPAKTQGFRPLPDLGKSRLLTAARTGSGWIGLTLDEGTGSTSLKSLEASAESLVERLLRHLPDPRDLWITASAHGILLAKIHGNHAVEVFGVDGSHISTVSPTTLPKLPGEWVQLRPIFMDQHLLLSISNLHSEERILVYAPIDQFRGIQKVKRVTAPVGLITGDSELGLVVGVRRTTTQEIVGYRVERSGPNRD